MLPTPFEYVDRAACAVSLTSSIWNEALGVKVHSHRDGAATLEQGGSDIVFQESWPYQTTSGGEVSKGFIAGLPAPVLLRDG